MNYAKPYMDHRTYVATTKDFTLAIEKSSDPFYVLVWMRRGPLPSDGRPREGWGMPRKRTRIEMERHYALPPVKDTSD